MSASKELFLLIYDLNGSKFRANVPGGKIKLSRCYKDVYLNSFYSKIWDFLSASKESFPLIYDLNGFKSRVYKQLIGFPIWFSLMASSFFL